LTTGIQIFVRIFPGIKAVRPTACVYYFASNADSSYVTGNVLPILGGETIAG
tara:strand:- start:187 stop:342 length:156 start_codon:yes stop_codon:yes gene_type:complete